MSVQSTLGTLGRPGPYMHTVHVYTEVLLLITAVEFVHRTVLITLCTVHGTVLITLYTVHGTVLITLILVYCA